MTHCEAPPLSTLIDVHHHATLQVVTNKQEELGLTVPDWLPKWSPEIAVDRMDEIGTTASLLSLPSDLGFLPPSERPALIRAMNEELTLLVSKNPSRFGAFASLPMLSPDDATAEAVRALDELELEGICILSSYDGAYLSDPHYEELLDELNKRRAVVFVHPILVKEKVADLPPALLEGTFDTTRFATKMAAANAFERYPNIRFILPHTGGMVPYIKWRIAMYALQGDLWTTETDPADFDREIAKLDGLYYDTTLNLGPLQHLERPDRILFGTDIPWCSKTVLHLQRDKVFEQAAQLGPDNAEAIASGNALALFPRLAERIR
ncbi:amidohydrolase family protein [Paenarthrobacter sp. NPDC091711]|uniref:amidohydrolase family protein n=1 Tax=Paenarthrobacter sp. NPDC091711 TaxID=3364385 RepID=UPI00381AF3F8